MLRVRCPSIDDFDNATSDGIDGLVTIFEKSRKVLRPNRSIHF